VPTCRELFEAKARLFRRRRHRLQAEQSVEALVRDRLDEKTHEEAIRERRHAVRDLVRCGDDTRERHRASLGAVVEDPLVQDAEQGVQDRAVRLEDLVEERDVRGRQVPVDQPLVSVALERL